MRISNAVYNSERLSLEWGIGLKSIYWKQTDEYVVWKNIGIIPLVYGIYKSEKKISPFLSLGPQFNFNLDNSRKTYEKTGWVKKTDYEFQIGLSYEL